MTGVVLGVLVVVQSIQTTSSVVVVEVVAVVSDVVVVELPLAVQSTHFAGVEVLVVLNAEEEVVVAVDAPKVQSTHTSVGEVLVVVLVVGVVVVDLVVVVTTQSVQTSILLVVDITLWDVEGVVELAKGAVGRAEEEGKNESIPAAMAADLAVRVRIVAPKEWNRLWKGTMEKSGMIGDAVTTRRAVRCTFYTLCSPVKCLSGMKKRLTDPKVAMVLYRCGT